MKFIIGVVCLLGTLTGCDELAGEAPPDLALLGISSATSGVFETTYTSLTSELTLTLTNSGTIPSTGIEAAELHAPFSFKGGNYPGTDGTCGTSLGAGASCTIVIEFAPTRSGATTQTLTLFDTASFAALSLRGTGVTSTATLSISDGETYSFGTRTVSTTTTKSFTITNSTTYGRASARNISISGLGAPYAYAGGGAFPGTGGDCTTTLTAGNHCTVVLAFTPVASGVANTTLTVSYHNGATSTSATRGLTGTGLSIANLAISDGPLFNFGVVTSGAYLDKTFTLTNSGESTSPTFSVTQDPSGRFSYPTGSFPGGGNCLSSLTGGNANCTFIVRFSPLVCDAASAITIGYDDATGASASASRNMAGSSSFCHSLDTSFHTDGLLTTNVSVGDDKIYSLSVQTDGRIVAAGESGSFMGLARYTALGSLDTSFLTSGKGSPQFIVTSTEEHAFSVIVQTDGKSVVGGYAVDGGATKMTLSRFVTSGVLDTSFNTNGTNVLWVYSDMDRFTALSLQTDGNILVAGTIGNTGPPMDSLLILGRFLTDGSNALTFGDDGVSQGMTYADFGENAVGNALTLQTNAKIVVAGSTKTSPTSFALSRFEATGFLDTSFHTNGKFKIPVGATNDEANAVTLQTDGKIVVVGFSSSGANADFAIVRLDAFGNLDTSFHTDGKVTTAVDASDDKAYAVSIGSNGNLLVVGDAVAGGPKSNFAYVTYLTNGVLDTSFDTDGKLTVSLGTGDDSARALALQSDQKAVIGGFSSNGVNSDFALMRYQ